MSSSSRPLSCSLVAVPESCASSSSSTPCYFSNNSSSPHSTSSPSPSHFSSSSYSSHSSSSSFSSSLPNSNFGASAEYYAHQPNNNFPVMAATLDGNPMMMKQQQQLYNNSNSKLVVESSNFEQQQNNCWNGPSYQPQQQQQQQQQQQLQSLDQINFLVRKECCNEIDQAVKELGISADPFNWSVSDVAKWLLWMQRWVQLPTLKLEHFAMDGMSLCALSEEDFRQRVPNGEKLYAKLEIWRMAINYFGATEVLFDSLFGGGGAGCEEDGSAFGQQQQQQYCASPYSTSSSTDASSLYSGSSPIAPEGYGVSNSSGGSGCGSLPTYAESMYGSGGGMCSSSTIASPASPASSSHSSVNSCSPYGLGQQNSYGYGQSMMAAQQQQYGTKQTILPMNDFTTLNSTGTMISSTVNGGGGAQQHQRMAPTSDYGSDAMPSDDDDMSDDEKCFFEYQQQHHHRMTFQQQQQQHQQQLMQLQQQQQQQQMQSARALPQISKVDGRTSDYSPSTSPVYHHHHHNGLQHHQQLMQQQQHQYGHSRPVHHQQQQYAHQQHSISIVKSELPSSSTTTPIAVPAAPVSAAAPSAATPAPVAPVVRTSSSHIHLWQFLKELLSGPHQYGSSIRWLDRSKGVFKIEDSVSVAKLWGARKNRPAMNYDKLSRSIRQYYKKGIMKKTERSQRLVYQFCVPYAL